MWFTKDKNTKMWFKAEKQQHNLQLEARKGVGSFQEQHNYLWMYTINTK